MRASVGLRDREAEASSSARVRGAACESLEQAVEELGCDARAMIVNRHRELHS